MLQSFCGLVLVLIIMKQFSFVIPCYGSEHTIEHVIREIEEQMARRSELDYEVIAVNDCSPDGVWEILLKEHRRNPRVKLLEMARNMNRPGAVMAGLNHASGDLVVVMDDDGQCPMDRLWDLVRPIETGEADVSMAKYPERKQSVFKNFGTYVNQRMTELILDKPRELEFTNFMAIKRCVVREMVKYQNPYPYMTGLLLRSTKHIVNIGMEERSRHDGKATTFTFVKLLSLWMNGLTAFSVKPLRCATLLGFLFAAAGFLFGVYLVFRKLFSPDIEMGYSSIMVSIVVIGGLLMLMLGIIGEYLGRIYICLNKSPQYVVRTHIGFDSDSEV